jgi:type III secretory pathway component EscR
MKTWKLNSNKICLFMTFFIIFIGYGNSPVYASQLASKMNSMTTSLVILGQAGCGIGFVFGLIIAGLGASQIGSYIAKSALIVLTILFLYQPIINQIRSMTGS